MHEMSRTNTTGQDLVPLADADDLHDVDLDAELRACLAEATATGDEPC
jgi:hypothetical protein